MNLESHKIFLQIRENLIKDIRKDTPLWKEILARIIFAIGWLIFCFGMAIGMIIEADAQPQTITLPVWVIDSLVYESKLSRQCSNVVTAQQNEIEKLGLELLATGTALRLSQKESINLDSLLTNSSEQRKVDRRQYELDKSEMKEKIKRRNRFIVGESLAILLMILLL